MAPRRQAIRVAGTVQGVGFRPFVHAVATELGLVGFVGNDPAGVFIEAQGDGAALTALATRVRDEAPALAAVESLAVRDVAVSSPGEDGFTIVPSVAGRGLTSIPPDVAVCDDCLREMRDPADRRYGYAFIACTHCGPRFTITTGLPYDRENTTMVGFPLCDACREEYECPASRRFHAQPTACPDCGPRLSMPVADIAAALRDGRIVAVKGIGGYHLACDARDAQAVARLRARKQRGDKPFAVMAADLATARTVASVSPAAESLLASPARPVVVLPGTDPAVEASVAPRSGTVGVMLPYAPLHHLLFDAGAPALLVMTSGNLADEPICTDPAEAEERLAGIADVFCHHDRPIHVACDDSVLRLVSEQPQPVRRSRGYAPVPLRLALETAPVLAVGGELKTTVCLAEGTRAWLSQHIGDTANLETLDMLACTVAALGSLQRVVPELVVSDAHPGYLSRRWAERYAREHGLPHATVQHHHAHLAALLAEHRVPPGQPVLGLVLDGTGYGTDGTIWGGELLLGSYAEVRRVGALRPVALPGGDAAIRHPARTALAHLSAAGLPWEGTASAGDQSEAERRLLARMLATGSHCTPTTSMGRLFDAVSSLLGVCQRADYEGQAAVELEALAAGVQALEADPELPAGWRPRVQVEAGFVTIDPRGWVAQAVADRAAGVPRAASAAAFHTGLAAALTEAAVAVAGRVGVRTVGLTGGVFANSLLTDRCVRALEEAGLSVLVHRLVPPNDGGLALGQVAVASAGGSCRTERDD